MLEFNASVNEAGEFVLAFLPEKRDEYVELYAKAKGWEEEIYQAKAGQEGIPAQFRISEKIVNPISADEFICRLIEKSIAAVIVEPELKAAVELATNTVLTEAKKDLPL
jgi:hypothetical protein